MSALSIGLSGLSVSQRALEVIGNNVANVNTRGYHRQVVELATRSLGLQVGDGVKINDILRFKNGLLESAATQNKVEAQDVDARLTGLQQVESFMAPGDGSIMDLLQKFFSEVGQASSQPDNLARRSTVIGIAVSLTSRIQFGDSDFRRMIEGSDSRIRDLVSKINSLSVKIADLNQSIQSATLQGLNSNDLLDERDSLINQVAETIDIRTVDQADGQRTVLAAGAAVVIGNSSIPLQVAVDAANNTIITTANSSNPLVVSGGQIGGLLKLRNTDLPGMRGRLDTLAKNLARGVDELHATGIGLDGPMTTLFGQRAVNNVATPLASANLGLPPQAGSLFVSVTNQATGQRTVNEVAVTPAAQSLNDLAAAINAAVPNIQALVNTQSRTLQILAAPGFSFDFAGRLPTAPSTSALTGTATAQIGGKYTGTANDNYTFTVSGAGTIGVTPGLTLQVTDSAANLIGSLNIGQGFEPGASLPAVNGVVARMAAGTVNAGDSFTVRTVALPDTANILSALGLNTLFTGDGASNLAVRSDLQADPKLLAASLSGQPGDGSNLRKLSALQDSRYLSNNTQTLAEFHATSIGNLAIQVRDLSDRQNAQEILGQRLDAEIQSISGVDPNEELVTMLQFQRSFQLSARFISTVNSTLDDLIRIV